MQWLRQSSRWCLRRKPFIDAISHGAPKTSCDTWHLGWVRRSSWSARTLGYRVGKLPSRSNAQLHRPTGGARAPSGRVDQVGVQLQTSEVEQILNILRFLGIAVISSPAILWTGSFMHAFVFKTPCMSLKRKVLYGTEDQEALVRRYCASPPKQVCMLVGCNDGGKTALMSQILSQRPNTVHINFQSRAVTGVSSFVQLLADGFNVRYLKLRSILSNVLPFAGGEIFVMKERLSMHDMKEVLAVFSKALEELKAEGGHSQHIPVIYLDGIGDNLNQWQLPATGEEPFEHVCVLLASFIGHDPRKDTAEGQELLQVLLAWSVYVTKERQLAHVIFGTTPSFVSHVVYSFRDIHNNVNFIEVGDLAPKQAMEYLVLRKEKFESSCAVPLKMSAKEVDLVHRVVGGRVSDINRVFTSLEAGMESCVHEVLRSMIRHQRARILASFTSASPGSRSTSTSNNNISSDAEHNDDDVYLDPLKRQYSLLTDSHRLDDQEATPWPPWTPLQLWDTMEIITSTKHNHVPYHTLRNMIFDGDDVPLRALIEHDIVGCRVGRLPDRAGARPDMHIDSMYVTPFSTLMLNVFHGLVKDPRLVQMITGIREEIDLQKKHEYLNMLMQEIKREETTLAREKQEILQAMDIWEKLKEHSTPQKTKVMTRHLLNLQDRLLAKEKELIRHREIVDEVRQPLRDDAFSAVEDATEEPTTQSAQV